MAEETLEQRLAKLYAKRDFVDRFNEDDVKTLIDAIRDAREHGGTASVDITPISGGGGYTITITDSEGTEHTATVKDGGDAYEVYVSTVPQDQTPMSKAKWLASLKGDTGNDGSDGHNPCLGRFNVLPTLSPNPFADARNGDYIYFDTTDSQTSEPVTYIYHFDGTNWDAQGTVVDVSNLTFNSGESVPGTSIDGTGLANPASNALAKAMDVMRLAAKLAGVTATEVKVNQQPVSGYVKGADGTIGSSASAAYIETELGGAKSVRFLGGWYTSSAYGNGYAFGHYSDPTDLTTWVTDKAVLCDTGASEIGTKEYIVNVPNGATHFRTTSVSGSIPTLAHDFYCYLQSGDSVVTQEQLAEVRDAMPVVESFANKEANTIVLNEEIIKQLSLDECEKIDVDVSDFKNGLRYAIVSSTLKFGTNTSYSHTCVYIEGGDIVEIIGNATSDRYIYFLTSLVYSSGGDIPIVEGTEPIYVEQGKRVILQAPIGAKCIAFNISLNTNPQAITIYRKKHPYTSKTYTADDFIECGLVGYENNTVTYNATYIKSFIIPVKADFNYTLSLHGVGTSTKLLGFLRRLPNMGDSYEKINDISSTNETDIIITYKANNDGFIIICFSVNRSADCISINAVKSSVDMSDFVAPMLSMMKFNTPEYTLKIGYIYHPYNGKSGIFTDSASYKHLLLRVTAGDVVILKKGNNSIRYAFLTNDTLVAGTLANFVDGTGVILTNDDEVLMVIPPTANYLYIQDSYLTTSYLPSYIGILANNTNALTDDMQNRRDYNIAQATSVGLSKLNVQVDENGWEIPATLQQLNAQKKAEQLCNIEWTPKHNVPSRNDPYYYENNDKQTGIPYSSNNDEGAKKVGIDLSLHTFMTAVNNPYSLLYTECINNESKRVNPPQASAWGKVYTKSSNGYAYYGTVCCGLTSSVENSPIIWNNTDINNYNRTNGLYIQVCPKGTVDFNLIQIGDIADNRAHSFLIYGLHRDTNGNVDKVKIAESTSSAGKGKCRIVEYTKTNFVNHINKIGDPFALYRYVKLWDNTNYEPSEFVHLTNRGEANQEVTYNDAICTFAGDKVTFRSGDLVVINYNLNGTQPHEWTKIKVYKDDVLLDDGEYTLAEAEATLEAFYAENGDTSVNGFNPTISQHNHALVLGTELAAGKYKACMSDGTNDSDFTYWEIIPNEITIVKQGYDSYKVNVSGGFLEAIYVGSAFYLPTYDEQATNEFIIHPIALMQAWKLSYDGINVRVKLKGEYGRIVTTGTIVIAGSQPEPEPEPEPDDTNS